MPGLNNSDVTALIVFDERVFPRLVRNIDEFFPNLIYLQWNNCNLTSIESEDLKQFPNLRRIDAQHNQLLDLPGDLFAHTPDMQAMFIHNNLIESVGEGIFSKLDLLRIVDLKSNRCINNAAFSREEVLDLEKILLVNCPSLPPTTTEVWQCDNLRCSLNDEVDKLTARVEWLELFVFEGNQRKAEQEKLISDLVAANARYEERIERLEKAIAGN